MDVIDEPQLFGAGPGRVEGASITMSMVERKHGLIRAFVHTEMRERPMVLSITFTDPGQVPAIIGSMVPLMTRSANMSGEHVRRQLWWIHDKWGKQGYETSLIQCTRPKK